MFRIFIADDQILMREGLKMIIDKQEDMTVVGSADNGLDAFHQINVLQPDLVLMDIRMPVMDGIEATKLIKQQFPQISVVFLTTFNEEDYIIEGLAHKANGYLLKSMDYQQLVFSIREAAYGRLMLPNEVAFKLANRIQQIHTNTHPSSQHPGHIRAALLQSNININEREEAVIQHLLLRLSNKEIAEKMFMSEGTVKNYISDIYQKLQVKNRSNAIDYLKNLLK
ncbi:Transcriptional regulatory protein DegU [compost metagenome]